MVCKTNQPLPKFFPSSVNVLAHNIIVMLSNSLRTNAVIICIYIITLTALGKSINVKRVMVCNFCRIITY